MTTLDGDLSIVGDILCEFFSHYLVSFMGIKDWAESHGASASGRRSAHVTSNSNRREAVGTSNGKVGSPGLVEVELLNIILLDVLNAIMRERIWLRNHNSSL